MPLHALFQASVGTDVHILMSKEKLKKTVKQPLCRNKFRKLQKHEFIPD